MNTTCSLAAPPLAMLLLLGACASVEPPPIDTRPIEEQVEHGYVDSNGVQIHYATLGQGPLVVMLHGFPDYWYTWRDQMAELARDHQVVAIDLRGYNRSDKPEELTDYGWGQLIGDVVATIRHFDREQAIIVGHDWGGAIAWQFAMNVPDMCERLIICNLPHPRGLMRELANNPEQQANSQYAVDFQAEDAHERLTPEQLAGWVDDPAARALYVEAFRRSDIEGMLAYYKVNYPQLRSSSPSSQGGAVTAPAPTFQPVRCSVLMIHGLEDQALLPAGLNDTWEWIDADLTIVTIPGAGHFVQQDASKLVTRTMRAWLDR